MVEKSFAGALMMSKNAMVTSSMMKLMRMAIFRDSDVEGKEGTRCRDEEATLYGGL